MGMRMRLKQAPNVGAAGDADHHSASRRRAFLEVGGRVADFDHVRRAFDAQDFHQLKNEVRKRPAVWNFVGSGGCVNLFFPSQPADQNVDDLAVKARVESDPNSMRSERAEDSDRPRYLSHIRVNPIVVDHARLKITMNLIDSDSIFRLTCLQKKRLDRQRFRDTHDRVNARGIGKNAIRRERRFQTAAHTVGIFHCSAGNVEDDKLNAHGEILAQYTIRLVYAR